MDDLQGVSPKIGKNYKNYNLIGNITICELFIVVIISILILFFMN